MSSASAPVVVGLGNPLLDISAVVPEAFLEKYNVKLNNAILAEPSHLPMYDELIKEHANVVEYIAGGATQNSIRVCQWMMQKPGSCAYIGSVGGDNYAATLASAARADGVDVHYYTSPDAAKPTGTCAVLIHKKERSLIANLGAANDFNVEHLKSATVAAVLESARIVYSAGFFLTVSPPSLMHVAAICDANRDTKTFAMNLSAPFICQFFVDPLFAAMPFIDIIFGNESEAEALGKTKQLDNCDAKSVALYLSGLPKANSDRPRVAVITQGSSSTVVAVDGKIHEFAVPALDQSLIVDVNGAGDAFVGGYLACFSSGGRSIGECVDAGHYAARTILMVSGTKLPTHPPTVTV